MKHAFGTALLTVALVVGNARPGKADLPDDLRASALVFVCVHGFSEPRDPPPLEANLRGFLQRLPLKTAVFTYRWDRMRIDVAKVFAQWNQSKQKASDAAKPFLADVLLKLEAERVPYVIVAYSLGTRVVAESLKQADSRLQHVRGVYFLGSALRRSYRLNAAALPEGMRIVNYYSEYLDEVLKISFFAAEGVRAGGEMGFDDTTVFQNYRTVCTHIHKGGPLERDYSNLAPAIAYLSLFREKILVAGEPVGTNVESPVGSGSLHWNDLARFATSSGAIMLQQNAITGHYRAVAVDGEGKRVRKAWGGNPHSLLQELQLFPGPYARVVRQGEP